jgi:hypothetical protein
VSEHELKETMLQSVAAEHRSIQALFEEMRDAFRREDGERAARVACARLRAALEAHYAREESLYYPSIWALRPDQKPALLDLIGAHKEFRAQLDAIAGDLEAGAFQEAEGHFEELVEVFSYHESVEEKLLQSLEREIRGLP